MIVRRLHALPLCGPFVQLWEIGYEIPGAMPVKLSQW